MKTLIYSFALLMNAVNFNLTAISQASFASTLMEGNDPCANLLNSFKGTKFSYFHFSNNENVGSSKELSHMVAVDPNQTNSTCEAYEDLLDFKKGVGLFEAFQFDEAYKIFVKHSTTFPENDVAKFYLSITQLYLGKYGPAATNLSLLNKKISLGSNGLKSEFLDDIKFYFAISSFMISDERKIAKTLFSQLNYDGGKYHYIAKEMSGLF